MVFCWLRFCMVGFDMFLGACWCAVRWFAFLIAWVYSLRWYRWTEGLRGCVSPCGISNGGFGVLI